MGRRGIGTSSQAIPVDDTDQGPVRTARVGDAVRAGFRSLAAHICSQRGFPRPVLHVRSRGS